MQSLAELWNTGYNITSMPTDEGLLVGAGMWVVKDFQADDGGYISFEPNPNWRGEMTPSFNELVIRFIGDANAQITALQNGEVQIIEQQRQRACVNHSLEQPDQAVLDPGPLQLWICQRGQRLDREITEQQTELRQPLDQFGQLRRGLVSQPATNRTGNGAAGRAQPCRSSLDDSEPGLGAQ